MDFHEYRQEFLSSVRIAAESDQESTVTSFVKEAADNLLEAGVIPDYEPCFYIGNGKHNRRLRVDGYALDDYDMTMYLLVADFSGTDEVETLTMTQAKMVFDRVYGFIEQAMIGELHNELEISTPAYDLVQSLRLNQMRIRRFSLILVTDKKASEKIEIFPSREMQNIQVEYHIWDMNRFFKVAESESGRDELWINLKDYMDGGIPCLEASAAQTEEYRSFLCVLPGNVLADIYDKYGSRLLEGNVRSFLSTKRAVNKKIRETIISKPMRFFAYNNGISGTATEVVMEKSDSSRVITEIKGLQIVNGGQTTASLSNARFKDKASLDNIYIQMKLTEVDAAIANSIIPDISRSSNSQNKVSEADFFSNHAFHIQMEKMSRRIFAPAVGGAQFETHWFYERANGQYLQQQTRMKKSEKDRFVMMNPKKQKIVKTDLAKVYNAWRGLPQKVSFGAQKNFTVFAVWATEEWERDNTQFNELFFKRIVALTILFRQMGIMIKQQPWYENGYLANLVAYSMAKFSHILKENYPQQELDFIKIWDKQMMPAVLSEQLIPIYKAVYKVLTAQDRLVQNVTEWSKNNACWDRVKTVAVSLHPHMAELLMDKGEARYQAINAKRDQKVVSGIEAQMFVAEKGQEYWTAIKLWGKEKDILNPDELRILSIAGIMSGSKMPNEVQSKKLQLVREKVLAEGYQES